MRGLQHRVKRLENPRNQTGACPVCRPDGYTKLRAVFEGDPPEGEPPEDELAEETCAHCGRSLVLRLTFDDREMESIQA